ncbi:MAG: RtcB family protein [Planctomycetaceae bacterium]
MNNGQLRRLGIPPDCLRAATTAIREAMTAKALAKRELKPRLKAIVENPAAHRDDPCFGVLAAALCATEQPPTNTSIAYQTWGTDIDQAAHQQMRQACRVPAAQAAALMPDAHLGYGLPIGGVLAVEGAVIPYAVGVDIACRMKLSVLDLPADTLESKFHSFRQSLETCTRFGMGCEHEKPQHHGVLDQDWTVTRTTRERKDKAWRQLGTSGSGNHFVEFGTLRLSDAQLGLEPGTYVALLSHSGSRGVGAAVCSTYSRIAQAGLPRAYRDLGRLAWLDLESQAGSEYWLAMNLMGDYAAANHDVIHRLVSRFLGASVITGVENHHNFAWKETHLGRELIVHRKGATPAGLNQLGVIPGSMASPAFIVRGKGQAESLHSAAHGAGRRMSRTKARQSFRWNQVRNDLQRQGVHVLSAGVDEVPGAYKDIETVMQQQSDLVETIGRFDPRIVKMCDDGSRPED